jgi:hypothetical protein
MRRLEEKNRLLTAVRRGFEVYLITHGRGARAQ